MITFLEAQAFEEGRFQEGLGELPMTESGFFDGITQVSRALLDTSVLAPTFYQDITMLSATFLAPLDRVRALLPSTRLHPYRPTPWHSVVYIGAYEYRTCDIGPYNEVMIAVPVTLDQPLPLFTGLLRPIPAEPHAFVVHLPVTTEIALTGGIEFLALPKFLAEIEFAEEGDWISGRLSEAGQHILTLSVRKGPLQQAPRTRTHLYGERDGRLLRCLAIQAGGEKLVSKNAVDAKLELGEHRISQELRDLQLGRVTQAEYEPAAQLILTPAFETFAVQGPEV
jgi:hypothetical protein